jgi:ATP-binding cassette subfamily F protein 3
MLFIQDLTYRIAGRTLLDKASVAIPAGHRVGLVGPNGTGKSTLFKLISGELQADGGEISLIKGASMGMVRQDLPDDDTTLIDIVLDADTERASLMKEAETVQDPDRIGYIYTRLDEIRAYDAPARAATILAGLGFNEAAQNSPISSFSGGWRARVALAAALFREPNLLLLDEPTNHLDLDMRESLTLALQSFTGAVILVSHDQHLLKTTVDRLLLIKDNKLQEYQGDLDDYLSLG